jgi:alkanesulfonate monooxygenase SsuD/methylene tetrahydromethanopterin reductase-like flavin-dependent oxidoreductase (luciferase family)
MKYGIDLINAGHFADPRHAVEIAQAAEASGWDGLFLWDALAFIWNGASGDPWVTLAAVAASTEKLIIGTAVTPVPRRRPQVLAQHLVSLDLLSRGRTVFGAGIGGVAEEFKEFGQPFELKAAAAMLDEGLDVITGLWTGEPLSHHGDHYTVENVTFKPRPVQRPRIPIWIGGESRPAMRRASRWDGWIIGSANEHGHLTRTPAQLERELAFVTSHRTDASAPFDVAIGGQSEPGDLTMVREFEKAGATWWNESIHQMRATPEALLARVKAGPPKA